MNQFILLMHKFHMAKMSFPEIEHSELVAKSLILYHIFIDIQIVVMASVEEIWRYIQVHYSHPVE